MPDNDSSAGATPAAAGATPAQSTPVSPAPAASPSPAPTTPATGDADLGEGGKRALEAERRTARDATDRANALQKQLDDLKAAGQSDQEKAISDARKDASKETATQFQALIRSARVEAALSAAGVDPQLLDLAVRADEFSKLKVTDEGTVEGLTDAVEALKKARPALFAKPGAAPGGTADGGTRGKPATTKEQVEAWSKDPAQYEAHRDEIFAFMATTGQ